MMIKIIRIELIKSMKNRYYLISLVMLLVMVIYHIVFDVIPYYGLIDSDYPETVFNHWIGLEMSGVSRVYYMVVVELVALPIGMVYLEEKNNGYFNQLIVRAGRSRVAISKLWAYLIASFILSTIPLLFDYMIAAILLPSIRPISATSYYTVSGNSLMAPIFYTQPTLYLLLYIIIDGLLICSFSLLVIPASIIIKNMYAAVCLPIVVFIVLRIVLGFVKLNNFIPEKIIYPSMSDGVGLKNAVVEIHILGLLGVAGLLYEVNRYET